MRPENEGVPERVPLRAAPLIVGLVRVLFVRVWVPVVVATGTLLWVRILASRLIVPVLSVPSKSWMFQIVAVAVLVRASLGFPVP
jgi:hypothetical protein